MHTGFWWGNPREGDRLKDPDAGGRIILKWIERWDGGMDWIDLTQRGTGLLVIESEMCFVPFLHSVVDCVVL